MLEARSGDGLVFLDLETDEYSCCYDPDCPIGAYADLVAPVCADGLDQAHPVAVSRWVDAQQSDVPRPGIQDIVRFIMALIQSRMRFRGRSVGRLAFEARQLGSRKRSHILTAQQASNLFRYLLSLTPFRPKCLFRSFALLHFLDRYGLGADWVFGVQLFPFRAHCWLSTGDLLLNELSHGIEDFRVIWIVAPARP